MSTEKSQIITTIDTLRPTLITLSHNIHSTPELGFQEFQAVKYITETLESQGYTVEQNYCGIPTSFRAVKKGKAPGPRVSFLAEYDALRGIGHGCGHNVIATCAVGAFLGLASVMDNYDGEVSIIGTPAEEHGAGKAVLLERGAFEQSDYALMMHPSGGGTKANLIGRGGRASGGVTVSFQGKAAHSSVPANGVNALNAAISLFNQIDMLRPTFEMQDNINGVILEGGVAGNIIPEFAKCEFCIRAETMHRIEELIETVKGCIERASQLTGAVPTVELEPIYAERYSNMPMCEAFKANMEALGVPMCYPDPKKQYGSSDIGNVSIKIPSIHDYLSITDDETIQSHSTDYTKAAAMPEADEVCIKGAKGLAMTGLDILKSEEFRKEINAFHEQQIPDCYK
ncbi:amidohydrolase [Clostridium sp. MCC353]|uniref:amidohydrolase n=1 Tax=Clostridium sp. MCC353 TaxID=2592646 RepID=UPI001C013575|nr:amidohydrolase [Clostridium sp. MCC353]MBT9777202.1 amidohydrolase [Clostridium sp. MCC353]